MWGGKRGWMFLSILILSFLLLAGCGSKESAPAGGDQSSGNSAPSSTNESASTEEKVAKIGVISWLTGDGAAYGEAITNGFKMAQEELNEQNQGKLKVELIIEDSAGKRDQALNAAQKLINSDEVVAILGPTLSSEMFVVGPEANAAGVPIMGTSTTAKGITDIGEYVFRNALPESLAIPAAIKKAVDAFGIKKVALMYGADDDFTKSGFETMQATSEKMGLEILTIEKFSTGDADFKAQLTKIQSLNPDAIFVSALYKEGGLILDQARKLGLNVPVVGGNGFNSPQVSKVAGQAAEGILVASPWFPEREVPAVQEFVKKYEGKYGKKPDQFAAQAYDALRIMAEALLQIEDPSDRDALRDALAGVKDFDGVTGKFAFDENRDPVMDPVILTIKDGKFVEFK
ncbi:ABC transporter substrate-binding protein [Microaerobacter geothermalis]|uniref:ABC transporter substrate-binding protein n=1 Tax=Microaerobacter geothermalis TaxID=674972 RepID=UPI001F433071|nr:ABC transporter substrate-binding protein [Microaerobacter geothermalis]MCF6093936.1 ABC transporter substrate-binding protein [Microaerobacter geothermalis]